MTDFSSYFFDESRFSKSLNDHDPEPSRGFYGGSLQTLGPALVYFGDQEADLIAKVILAYE